MEPAEEKLLKDYTDSEKGAYISAIASIATADRSATEDELDFLEALADAADLSPEQRTNVRDAAVENSAEELKKNLDTLRGSELRFSLLTDLVAFAEADQDYSDAERENIHKIAQYLNINQEQFSTINQFVQKASTAEVSEEAVEQQGFLGSLGMEDKFKKAAKNFTQQTTGTAHAAAAIEHTDHGAKATTAHATTQHATESAATAQHAAHSAST